MNESNKRVEKAASSEAAFWLFALFDAKGQEKWERKLKEGKETIPTVKGYVRPSGNKLELYGKDKKLTTSQTFAGSDL